VRPADRAVPPDRRNVFVDNREPAITQHAADFIQHEPRILRMMQHVAKQHRIEALVLNGKMPAVVRQVINESRGAWPHVQTDDSCTKHRSQMMCDEAVAAADVENVRVRRQHACDFERHVVCSSDFTTPSHAFDATIDDCG